MPAMSPHDEAEGGSSHYQLNILYLVLEPWGVGQGDYSAWPVGVLGLDFSFNSTHYP